MARRYRVRMGAYEIGRWEFQEVQAMARRYREMMHAISTAQSRGADKCEVEAMRWECSIIDRALMETAGGKWVEALRKSCCDGVAYEDIDRELMPTSNRNAFFRARREFYYRVWQLRTKGIGWMASDKKS